MCNCRQGSFCCLAFFIFAFMKKLLLLFLFFSHYALAQEQIVKSVLLDSVTVTGVKEGFDIDEFIHYVKTDTTFYMAFKHMRFYSHNYKSELNIFNKKKKKVGELKRWGTHFSDGKHAWVVDDSIYDEGKIFTKKVLRLLRKNTDTSSSVFAQINAVKDKYRYYTPEAFDEVFFPTDTIGVSLKISDKKNENESQNMRDAKTVGFSVGDDGTEQKKGGMSVKLAVFDISMQKYYDYKIDTCTYKGKSCYSFVVEVKKDLSDKQMEEALIRKIVSYFDKDNFNVIFREYKFVYNHWIVDLDMHIVVDMDYFNDKHIPTDIYYKGFWNVPFFKPERAEFKLSLSDYKVN